MAHMMRSLGCVLLLAAACVAQQQQTSQQSSQVKLEDIERETPQQRPQGAAQPGPQQQEVPQLTPQQIAAFQQQYLVQPQQYFAPQFQFPEFQGVPLTYVPAGNHPGANVGNVPPFQAYFVPQHVPQHVVPVVPHGGQGPVDAFRAPFTQQFIQHPGPQQLQVQQGVPQGLAQGQRTVSVIPPNNAVYRTIQPPFGANLIYTNPPALPQQIIFTQPQPQAQFGVNSFQQRPSKAQYSSGVKSTPATPTKSPDYSNFAQTSSSAAASSASGSTAADAQYRFSG